MSNLSITSLLRQPFIVDHFVQKPQDAAADDTMPNYEQRVEIFVYNATAKIANAAVVTAVVTAAAAMLSMVSVFFAALTVGASAALYLHAATSLPIIENRAAEGRDPSMFVVGVPPRSVESRFGIPNNKFHSGAGKIWERFAYKGDNIWGGNIWANTLPTNRRDRSESSSSVSSAHT